MPTSNVLSRVREIYLQGISGYEIGTIIGVSRTTSQKYVDMCNFTAQEVLDHVKAESVRRASKIRKSGAGTGIKTKTELQGLMTSVQSLRDELLKSDAPPVAKSLHSPTWIPS